ncbi:hypothetical protein H4R20_001460 [Coemansia guatemalensis]|uniref:Uncharacterized protein n=1 Tax=Coemansia guatemalensis TaxID=2761395 RepID=A0A9W8HXC8_9FUNG|nr:hypothetical protein H4R20_001460 [Coemansia guatemalensis]
MDSDVHVVKVPLSTIGWKGEHLRNLERHVNSVHDWVKYAGQLGRYILLREFEINQQFNETSRGPLPFQPQNIATALRNGHFSLQMFFRECLLALSTADLQTIRDGKRIIARNTVRRYVDDFKQLFARFEDFNISTASQTAEYEATRMAASYDTAIKNNFARALGGVVNTLLNAHERVEQIEDEMARMPEEVIRNAREAQVWGPARILKESLWSLRSFDVMPSAQTVAVRALLQPFFTAYGGNFSMDSADVFTDIENNALRHLCGYYALSKILEDNGHPQFQAFPLRTGWIPRYTMVDTIVLHANVLMLPGRPPKNNMKTWARVVNLGCKQFRIRNRLSFEGTIITNGVTGCIVKAVEKSTRFNRPTRKRSSNKDDGIPMLQNMSQQDIEDLPGPLVAMDPGFRQIVYGCSADSTRAVPKTMRITAALRQEMLKTHIYDKIRARVKPVAVTEAETTLGMFQNTTMDVATFCEYIQVHCEVEPTLKEFYSNTRVEEPEHIRRQRIAKKQLQHQRNQDQWWDHEQRSQNEQICERNIQQRQWEARSQQQTQQQALRHRLELQDMNARHERQNRRLQQPPQQLQPHQQEEQQQWLGQQQLDREQLHLEQGYEALHEIERHRELQDRQDSWRLQRNQYSQEHQQQYKRGRDQQRHERRVHQQLQQLRTDGQRKQLENRKKQSFEQFIEDMEEIPGTTFEELEQGYMVRHNRREQRRPHRRQRRRRQAALRSNQTVCREDPEPPPLHRKLQQSAYMNKKRYEHYFAQLIRLTFGLNPTLLLGNWSARNMRGQAPTPGVGLRRMLLSFGFRVIHIDEYLTSTMCPYCGTGQLEKFLLAKNPRPRSREERPTITSHALLRCNSVQCIGRVAADGPIPSRPRCMNRDLAAAMNFLHIANSLKANGVVPERFRRGNHAGGGQAAAPNRRPARRRRRN